MYIRDHCVYGPNFKCSSPFSELNRSGSILSNAHVVTTRKYRLNEFLHMKLDCRCRVNRCLDRLTRKRVWILWKYLWFQWKSQMLFSRYRRKSINWIIIFIETGLKRRQSLDYLCSKSKRLVKMEKCLYILLFVVCIYTRQTGSFKWILSTSSSLIEDCLFGVLFMSDMTKWSLSASALSAGDSKLHKLRFFNQLLAVYVYNVNWCDSI